MEQATLKFGHYDLADTMARQIYVSHGKRCDRQLRQVPGKEFQDRPLGFSSEFWRIHCAKFPSPLVDRGSFRYSLFSSVLRSVKLLNFLKK